MTRTYTPSVTLVAASIPVHDVDAALADAVAARNAGADLLEFRLDEAFDGTPDESRDRALVRLVSLAPLPCIVTCRLAREGGHYDGDEDARLALFQRLANARERRPWGVESPPRYIDIELSAYEASANLRQKVHNALERAPGAPASLAAATGHAPASPPSLILSIHDPATRPTDLSRRLTRLASVDRASILKVAFRARSLRDSLELLDLPSHLGRPTIALGMGEFGVLARLLAPKFGGFLTFASLRPSSATAPGQPTIRELLDTYRFRVIRADSPVFGVVGFPVAHSLSPLVHNAAFDALPPDHPLARAVYLPLPIAASDDPEASYASFKATILELIHHPRLTFRGCSVTMPHKANLARLAREQQWGMDDASLASGVANTLVLAPPADFTTDDQTAMRSCASVHNTDVVAVSDVLSDAFAAAKDRRVVILGTGGMARAVALAAAGVRVTLVGRDLLRARDVAGELSARAPSPIHAASLDEIDPASASCVVNATPVGMAGSPREHDSPLPAPFLAALPDDAVVAETVYRPRETPLLRLAAQRGLRAISGDAFFVAQARAQSILWTRAAGREADPPPGLFESIAVHVLKDTSA